MRECVLDTETSGLDFEKDRIVEIGVVEIVDLKPTGRTFHSYYNPTVPIHPDAERVHGLGAAFLSGFKPLKKNYKPVIDFIGDAPLVIHNGKHFDIKMLDAEWDRIGIPRLTNEVVDTLELAKKLKPGGQHSLNVMARHFGVSLAKRVKHGAVVDCEILAAIYLHLRGGPQAKLALPVHKPNLVGAIEQVPLAQKRAVSLPSPLTFEDEIAHLEFVRDIPDAMWLKYLNPRDEGDCDF